MDGRGSGDERPCRQHRDTPFQQCASSVAPAAGTGIAKPLCQRRAVPPRSCHPRHERYRRDRCGGGAERRTRPVDQSAYRATAQAQSRGHLLVAVALDRGPHQRVALQLRECGKAGERLADRDPPLEVRVRSRRPLKGVTELLVVIPGRAERVHGSVVDDPVQPRPRVSDLGAALEREPGLEQALLEGVVRSGLGQEQAAAVAQQRPPVTVDQRFVGPFVTVPRGGEETLVRLGLQEANGDPGAHLTIPIRNQAP
jgi:hypothetical protein